MPGGHHTEDLWHRLGVTGLELRWDHLSRRLQVPLLVSGLLAQFDGYGDLDELDWDAYRARYGDIGRLDLVLEAENDTNNRYQASKQADVLMLFYLLSAARHSSAKPALHRTALISSTAPEREVLRHLETHAASPRTSG